MAAPVCLLRLSRLVAVQPVRARAHLFLSHKSHKSHTKPHNRAPLLLGETVAQPAII